MKFRFVFRFMTNATTHQQPKSHFQCYSTLKNNDKLHLSWRSSRGSTRPTSFALFVDYTSPFWSKEKKTRHNQQQQQAESTTNKKPRYARGKKRYENYINIIGRESVNMTKPTTKQLHSYNNSHGSSTSTSNNNNDM